ncbi:DUF3482 domain-containing protein [Salinisphaera hydrothermalis]|uniref:HSR1-like GTP-binding protein n=1 Tax=Salinisphaera hydrothermalis (strain C41B8) TaxID=1304275 RepID=A0A084IMZ8_SALHC|nr:DUF3482 domain-containing protein [Salinisphaera hydrothermalis]KEZ78082.1 HSR1-like GTP-binding protein [Salinisphaera hydrothermalis C41B8]
MIPPRNRESGRAIAWVAPGVPTFAVVGKVNMGKSAVLATLLEEDDDAIIRISAEPGETTRCQRLSLVLDGDERLRFIDTPGFQQPIEALRAIRALAADPDRGPGPDTLAAFVARYRDTDEFVDECRLLEPLIEGAGVLYVVDPDVRLHDAFIAEIEILRLSAGPRLAVLNPHHRETDADPGRYADAWRTELGKSFNLVRTFDAFAARYTQRRELLAALNRIDERDRAHLDTTIALLDAEWQQRREEAAERIQSFLRSALSLREHADYAETDAPEAAKRRAMATAGQRYYARIAELERETANALLYLYRHRHTRAAAASPVGEGLDLAHDETWRRFGLTRRQLTFAGAAVGAGAGVSVDAGTLGHTLGLGTLIGGGVGGALAYFKGDALPTLSVSLGRAGARIGGGRRITLGPPKNPNFAWILLDSVLIRYRAIIERTHAARDVGELAASADGGDKAGAIVHRLASDRQKRLARWFREAAKGRDNEERAAAARADIEATLAEIEAGPRD